MLVAPSDYLEEGGGEGGEERGRLLMKPIIQARKPLAKWGQDDKVVRRDS